MRLDKYLADMSMGTRSEVKELIKKGRVKVDGIIVKKADTKVESTNKISVDDKEITYIEYEYYLLNKPKGYVCALEDKYYPVIMELIKSQRKDLVPVGRLDLDTEGVILITNDGKLNHHLLAPKSHVEKKYYVEVDNSIPKDAIELFKNGIDLKDFVTKEATLEIIENTRAYLTISEGKFHQVKRMFEAIGCKVTYLQRVQFAFLTLDGLKLGESRKLSDDEINKLKSL